MNDEIAVRSLEPAIEALKASISMQKAVANHFVALEKLRAYGYSNGFISAAISKGSGKTISPGLFASMMYRARKTSGVETLGKTQVSTFTTSQPISPALPKNELEKPVRSEQKPVTRTRLRDLRNEQEDWAALAEGQAPSPHPWAHLGKDAKGTGDRRRNDFTYDPTPDPTKIYPD